MLVWGAIKQYVHKSYILNCLFVVLTKAIYMQFYDCHCTFHCGPHYDWGICRISEVSFLFPATEVCVLQLRPLYYSSLRVNITLKFVAVNKYLVPNHYHLLPAVKCHLGSHKFQSDYDMETAMLGWLQLQDTDSCHQGTEKPVPWYNRCLNSGGYHVEKWSGSHNSMCTVTATNTQFIICDLWTYFWTAS
jgi:hypothetical protein